MAMQMLAESADNQKRILLQKFWLEFGFYYFDST